MNGVRLALATAGTAAGLYGVVLLLTGSTTDLRSIALWFAGVILVHDLLLAPLIVAGGAAASRVLPSSVRPPLVVGALGTLALLAVAAPVLFRQGALADNPTFLDRDYPAGLAVALGLLWAAVAVVVVVRARRGRSAVAA